MTAEEQKLLDLTNAERAKEKLPPLAAHPILFRVARAHSANMARKDEMKHVLDGKNPARRTLDAGYDYKRVGENIGDVEFGKPPPVDKDLDDAVLKDVMQHWMESPEHRKNILNKGFEDVGLGVARNEKGKAYFTQLFATVRKPPPD
jgi:uncharacterized protein YkwD